MAGVEGPWPEGPRELKKSGRWCDSTQSSVGVINDIHLSKDKSRKAKTVFLLGVPRLVMQRVSASSRPAGAAW